MFLSDEAAGIGVPDAVRRLAGDAPVRAVWRNELGGLTFAVGAGTPDRYVKWAPAGSGLDLGREADRLRWARPYLRVPEVVTLGGDASGSWLMTEAIPAESAASPRWRSRPEVAVPALGAGLRHLHDRLPVAACPYSWAADARARVGRERAVAGLLRPEEWHADVHPREIGEVLAVVGTAPPVDVLVVCHGDACAPNTLLDESGTAVAHLDFGNLGVADRWADLAVATWSTHWNYGPGWEDVLLAAYGVAPDPRRTAYYRLLWELGP